MCEPICVACLAGVIGAAQTDTQDIVDALLANDTFERGWTCGSCSRARATIAYIRPTTRFGCRLRSASGRAT